MSESANQCEMCGAKVEVELLSVIAVFVSTFRYQLMSASRFLCLALMLPAPVVCAHDSETVPECHQNVVYGEAHGVGLLMDIFIPTKNRNGTAVVDVISGGWQSTRINMLNHDRARVFRILCRHGYTVFAVRPGSLSRFSVTDMVKNLETGIVYVKERADAYEIDPQRIGLMGASAGGHLASLLAVKNGRTSSSLTTNSASVAAVATFYPLTDFLALRESSGQRGPFQSRARSVRRLMEQSDIPGLSGDELERRLAVISPVHHVTRNAPPFLLIHGDADETVPISQSQALQKRLEENGVSAELVVKQGAGHLWPTIHEEVEVIADCV